MAHLIQQTNGRINAALDKPAWHGLGHIMQPLDTIETWWSKGGLDFEALKVPAYAHLADGTVIRLENQHAIVRHDTHHVLSNRTMSDQYKPVQPSELREWFRQYISVNPDFQMSSVAALLQGERIFATAKYNGGMTVAGAKHDAYLAMTTSFDGTMATHNFATMVKIVCNNTLQAGLADGGASRITTSHRSKFDANRVGKELAKVISGFAAYKAMGEEMATRHLEKEQINKLFRHVLDIPFEAGRDDVSTRKLNQFDELSQAYTQTVREENNTHIGTAWAALNAVTRYVDHDRGSNNVEKQFVSAQFGSGAALKAKAVTYLDEICDGELLRAVAAKTASDGDVTAILKQSFRPTLVG